MTDRPILFSAPMVRALLAGTKTQTRRVVKHQWPYLLQEPHYATGKVLTGLSRQPGAWMEFRHRQQDEPGYQGSPASTLVLCPYGKPGDRLWVRESHWWFKDEHDPVTGYFPPKLTREDVEYRADGDDGRKVWRPSIYMPRWASRITLEVTGVRVERLQDISEADALAEGVTNSLHLPGGRFANENYAHLWDTINGEGAWEANPWVWCVEFKRVEAA